MGWWRVLFCAMLVEHRERRVENRNEVCKEEDGDRPVDLSTTTGNVMVLRTRLINPTVPTPSSA
jgi:hypothetical protein